MSDKKTKLVIFSAFYEPYMSGAEQMVKEIVERLDGNKYEITLITGRFDRKLLKNEKRKSFDLIRVGIGHKKIDKILYPFLAALRAQSSKPQVVHAIMESYAGIALVILKKIQPGVKCILTLQSGDLDDESKQKKFLIRFFWKKIHTVPDKVTAISSFLASRAEKMRGDKVDITPNGVDFSEVPADMEKIKNRVVMVGRLSWEKGHNFLIQAWPQVLKEISDAKLVLVGEGNKRSEIEKMIQDLHIQDSVKLTGNLPHNQVLTEIKKSEIFVCPSLAEGLGNVFIESQACGVPPIGTRVGGIPDVITDNQTGLLIEPKSSEAISSAIIKLIRDKEMIKRFSEKGLETVKKFDWNTIVNNIDKIYQDILRQ